MSDVQDEATDISICESASEFDFPLLERQSMATQTSYHVLTSNGPSRRRYAASVNTA